MVLTGLFLFFRKYKAALITWLLLLIGQISFYVKTLSLLMGKQRFAFTAFYSFLEGRLLCKQLPLFLPQRGRPVPTCGRCRNGPPFLPYPGQ